MIVLDTHAWIWWLDEAERLSATVRDAIHASDRIAVSAITAFEIATLMRRGRLNLDRPLEEWMGAGLALPRVVEEPVTAAIALGAGTLPEDFPGDPSDRLIYATARTRGATLVTRDERIRTFDPRGTVW